MKKILFPTDFSETANHAFVYALQLAKRTNAEITVLHVYELPILDYSGLHVSLHEVFESLEMSEFDKFKGYIPALRKIAEENNLQDVPMIHLLRQGDFVWTVKDVVEEEGIDYIILGTKGAKGLKKTFIGSNASSLLNETNKDVLIIPEGFTYSGFNKILFPTKFKPEDKKTLKHFIDLTKTDKPSIDCLYIKNSYNQTSLNTIEEWKNEFKDYPITYYIEEKSDVKDCIKSYIDKNAYDAIAMLTYKRSFFEELFKTSIAKELSYDINIPLYIVHE
jgi:nucleotide-binding universal stress UspA family protein